MKHITLSLIFAVATLCCITVVYAEQSTTTTTIVFDESAKGVHLDKEIARELASKKIDAYTDTKGEIASFLSVDFWTFPLQIMTLENHNTFSIVNETHDGSETVVTIGMEITTEEVLLADDWRYEIGWRIFPFFCCIVFCLQNFKKLSKATLEISAVGVVFMAGMSGYITYMLGAWDTALMREYFMLLAKICAGTLACNFCVLYFFRKNEKMEEEITIASLRARRIQEAEPEKVITPKVRMHPRDLVRVKKRTV